MYHYNSRSLLSHSGVKGMKWGVRRYRNTDGSLTYESIARTRATRAEKTRADVNAIVDSMSKKDKNLLNIDKEYLTQAEGQFVVKRILHKQGATPIAFFDLLRDGDRLEVALGTRSGDNYRGKGYATEVAKKGMQWCENNKDKWDTVIWGAKKQNAASNKLAKKMNFELKDSNDEWNVYAYQQN